MRDCRPKKGVWSQGSARTTAALRDSRRDPAPCESGQLGHRHPVAALVLLGGPRSAHVGAAAQVLADGGLEGAAAMAVQHVHALVAFASGAVQLDLDGPQR